MKNIAILTILMLCVTAQAANMITVGGDQTAGTGTLTINYDITFNVTAGSSAFLFVFDEIATADASGDNAGFSGLEYSINGGDKSSLSSWRDNLGFDLGDMTPNDGHISGVFKTVSIGDTVTLHAGTGTMTSTKPNFSPWASGNYDMFMADGSGNQISDVVPEPATAGLLGISAVVFYALRRIKNFNRPL